MKNKLLFLLLALVIAVSTFGGIYAFASDEAPETVEGEELPAPKASFYGATLVLSNTVEIRYIVNAEGVDDYNDISVLVWKSVQEKYVSGTEDYTLVYNGATTNIGGVSFPSFDFDGVGAQKLADEFYAVVALETENGTEYSAPIKYGALNYAYACFGKLGNEASADEELVILLKELLEYGAASQRYAKYKTYRLATADFYYVNTVGGKLCDGFTSGLYLKGDKITLNATKKNAEGFIFAYWQDSKGKEISTLLNPEITLGAKNETYTAVYLECINHEFGEWYTVTHETCTSVGLEKHECQICGDVEERERPMLPHPYESVVTEPTCEEKGYTTYTCHCGDSYVDSYVDALGHKYNSEVTEPTCAREGYTTHTCHCGAAYVDTYVAKLPHKIYLTETTETAFTNYTVTNDSSYPFDVSDNLITSTNREPFSASVYTVTAARAFTLRLEYKVSSEEGYDFLRINHNSTEIVKASGEGQKAFVAVEISMNSGDVVTVSYSKDENNDHGSDCAWVKFLTVASGTEIIENTSELTVTDELISELVSCTDGIKCHVCNGMAAEPLGHDEVYHGGKDATCLESGYAAYVTCNRCDYTTYKDIEATGHNFIDKICTRCGEEEKQYVRDGSYIYFGEYPQTLKADDVAITEATDGRGYYLGSDGSYYAMVIAAPDKNSYKFSNGAAVTGGEVYYFKVEPIRWRILSEDGESALILCDSIIANRAYDDGGNNNYKDSDIRAWINNEFYNTAFNALQQEIILTTTVDNSLASTGYSENSYVCENTEDKLFLLSYTDITNSDYGFAASHSAYDSARIMQTSDYSRATGARMSTSSSYYGNGIWWQRSPFANYADYARDVNYDGYAAFNNNVKATFSGVVPAIRIRL